MPLTGDAKRQANKRADWRRRHPGEELPPDLRPARPTRPHTQTQTTDPTSEVDAGFCKTTADELKVENASLPPLTPREEKLIALVVQGDKSLAQCCREAGYGNGGSYQPSGDIYTRLRTGDLRRHIRAKMAMMGLLPEVSIAKIIEKHSAKETKFFKFNETQFQHQGIETRDVDAHEIQLKAAEDTLKAFGAFDRDEEDAGPRKGEGPTVLIEFVSRQATQQTQTQQQTTIAIDFARKGDGNGHNGGGA